MRRWLTRPDVGIDHLDPDTHGYLVCDVTPEHFTTEFVMQDGRRHAMVLTHAG